MLLIWTRRHIYFIKEPTWIWNLFKQRSFQVFDPVFNPHIDPLICHIVKLTDWFWSIDLSITDICQENVSTTETVTYLIESWVLELAHIGSNSSQMGQIWDFLRSVSAGRQNEQKTYLKRVPELIHLVLFWPSMR